MDTTAEDGTAEDATAELLKKGWTLRRSHQNPATHITMDATAESLQYNDVSLICIRYCAGKSFLLLKLLITN